ncbi:MAG: hypothetical protein K9K67_14840 [Bacteriovoracaceae bacterium]|nr:hypothetical protein [Bacteriovoracaceae bacterium]
MYLFLSIILVITATPVRAELTSDFFRGTSSARSADGGGGERSGPQTLNRSSRFKSCEQIADTNWKNIKSTAGETNSYLASAADKLQTGFFTPLRERLTSTQTGSNGSNDTKRDELFFAFRRVALCQAYFVSTDIDNYDRNLEQFTDNQEHTSALGAQGLECMSQPTQEAQQQCVAQNAGQGELKCTQKGPETHDYLKCKKIIQFIDGFAIGKQVMQVQQTFRAGSQQLESQDELARKARSQEGVQITDAMGAQRDSLEQQGNLAYEMAAFNAAQAGVLMSMISSFPRPDDMIAACEQNFGDSLQTHAETFLRNLRLPGSATTERLEGPEATTDTPPPEGLAGISASALAAEAGDIRSICEEAISTRNGENFLHRNQAVIDTMKGIAIKAGLEALANGAKGALLHDQAGLVEDAMKDIEEFEPPEFPVAEVPEGTASECLVNPEAEGCIAPNGLGFEGFRDGGFNANIGGSANLGNLDQGNLDSDEDGTNGAGTSDRSLIPNDFGVVQAEGVADNSFSDGTTRAGSIKTGQGAAAAGGGGAAAGGGGGLGAGGGARGPASNKKPSGTRDIKIKTKGDGLMGVGGRGRIGGSQKKPDNPFSKLLGKDQKGGNQTLNFRGPAQLGGKKGSIFQMISNRYNVVQSKDRLLKYEVKRP